MTGAAVAFCRYSIARLASGRYLHFTTPRSLAAPADLTRRLSCARLRRCRVLGQWPCGNRLGGAHLRCSRHARGARGRSRQPDQTPRYCPHGLSGMLSRLCAARPWTGAASDYAGSLRGGTAAPVRSSGQLCSGSHARDRRRSGYQLWPPNTARSGQFHAGCVPGATMTPDPAWSGALHAGIAGGAALGSRQASAVWPRSLRASRNKPGCRTAT